MNQAQINSLIRSVLKIAGTALAAHGLTTAASLVNSEDVFGLVVLLVAVWQSHQHHAGGSADSLSASPNKSAGEDQGNEEKTLASLQPAGEPPALLPAADRQASPAALPTQPHPTL
jgi:hypothetical protein